MKPRTNTEGDWKPFLNACGAKNKRQLAGKKIVMVDAKARILREYDVSAFGHSKNTIKVVGGILYIVNNYVIHFPDLTINLGENVFEPEELVASLMSPVIRKEFLLSISTVRVRVRGEFYQHPFKFKLEDWIGEKVTLAEKPTGYTSKDYPVTIGKQYKVLRVDGSNLVIQINKNETGGINYKRFKEFQSPA